MKKTLERNTNYLSNIGHKVTKILSLMEGENENILRENEKLKNELEECKRQLTLKEFELLECNRRLKQQELIYIDRAFEIEMANE